MGWLSVIVCNNDHIDKLATEPNLGQRLYSAILGLNLPEAHRERSVGPLSVISHDDAQGVQILLVGGRSRLARRLDVGFMGCKTDEEEEVKLAQALAEKHGYTLSKKRKPSTGKEKKPAGPEVKVEDPNPLLTIAGMLKEMAHDAEGDKVLLIQPNLAVKDGSLVVAEWGATPGPHKP